MTTFSQPIPTQPPAANTLAKELKQRMHLGADLPHRLLQTEEGRPYEAFGLSVLTKQATAASLAQQAAYLKNAQAQGGHEAHIQRNQQGLNEHIKQCLTHYVIKAQHDANELAIEVVIPELLQQLRDEMQGFEQHAQALAQKLSQAQKTLDAYGRSGFGNEVTLNPMTWFKAFLGSAVDYTDALNAFNQREELTAKYDAQRAAATLSLDVIVVCEQLQSQLQRIGEAARAASAHVTKETHHQRDLLSQWRMQDFCIDAEHATDTLLAEIALEPLLAKLMAQAQSNHGETVHEQAQLLTTPLVTEQVRSLDVPGLIRLELAYLQAKTQLNTQPDTQVSEVNHHEALRLAGKGTLDLLNRHSPIAILTPETQARRLRVQLTATGQPVFRAANMNTAALRHNELEVALGEALWEIALAELQAVQYNGDLLKQGRCQREFFAYAPIAKNFGDAGRDAGHDMGHAS